MLFFTASFDVIVESWCITYVTVDVVFSHFVSVIASVPNLFPRENYCDIIKSIVLEPYIRHGRFCPRAMHRMQIAGARIGPLMQIAKSKSIVT
jgi:hypothetical protein